MPRKLSTLVPPASVCLPRHGNLRHSLGSPSFLSLVCLHSHQRLFSSSHKAILQVEVGHLEACGLAAGRGAVCPRTSSHPRDRGSGGF